MRNQLSQGKIKASLGVPMLVDEIVDGLQRQVTRFKIHIGRYTRRCRKILDQRHLPEDLVDGHPVDHFFVGPHLLFDGGGARLEFKKSRILITA